MYLKKIEITGFKSFARQSILEFSTPITAIVGPNGAGKSNIAESVRFVLGEQSMKSLRGKRGEDLIFNGTNSFSRLNRASVAITFDNRTKIFDVDFDDVEIKRVVFRDGINEYYINGSQVRLKDIMELLASVRIGASSHHIISQGEADRILNATTKERRMMIEDALGLKIYQFKRYESERKLKKTKENIDQIEALRKEIAPHLRFLEKQMVKIEQTKELKTQLKTLYSDYLNFEDLYLRSQKKQLNEDYMPTKTELSNIEKIIKEQSEILSTAEKDDKKSALIIALEEKISLIRVNIDTLSRNLGRLEGIIEYGKEEIEILKNKGDEIDAVVRIPRNSITTFLGSIDEQMSEVKDDSSRESLMSIINNIHRTITEFFNEKMRNDSISSTENERKKKNYNDALKQKEQVESELNSTQNEEKKLYTKYRTYKEKIEKDRGEERKIERKLFELRNRKTELVTHLELLGVKMEKLKETETQFKRDCDDNYNFTDHVFSSEYNENGSFVEGEDRVAQDQKRREIERIKIRIEEFGTGSSDIVKEHEEVRERDEFLKNELEDLSNSAKSLDKLISELVLKIDIEFKKGVKKINKKFEELFVLMFGGGKASIKIVEIPQKKIKNKDFDEDGISTDTYEVDENTEIEEGIDINVSLPYKNTKGLTMLSGGERALTSIALIFSITQVNPPPFLILDETDAAFDEVNSRKYSNLLENLSKKTQCIIITHNRETMSHAGVLYGVTSTIDGISKLLSIKLEQAVEIAE